MNTQILKGYDNYIVFGVRLLALKTLEQLRKEKIEILYFCDNDPKKWGAQVDGIRVIKPDELPDAVRENNALVIIDSMFGKHEIASQLDRMELKYVFYSKPIFVELTSLCNHRCAFCPYEYIDREKGNLDWDIAKEFLYDLHSEKSDVLYPLLNPHFMGEPLLSKRFFDFMDLCKELEFYVYLVTNFALLDEKIQKRLFTEYEDLSLILSLQSPTEEVFHWRGEPRLTYQQWFGRIFEIIESKFKYNHEGRIHIHIMWPEWVNNKLVISDEELHIFEWFSTKEEFEGWKSEFGQKCLDFADEIRKKYPDNYKRLSKEYDPDNCELGKWVKADGITRFEFLPKIFIDGKNFGTFGAKKFFKTHIPDDKYIYWEENWYQTPEECDRAGDVGLLSSGQLVLCNVDNEAEFVIADLPSGEKYTDEKTQQQIKQLRNNLTLSPLCRRCRNRVHIFDTHSLGEQVEQQITHFGLRWHEMRSDESGEEFKVSHELSSLFVFPRIDANSIEIDISSVQDKRQCTLIKILSYDDETTLFTEQKLFSLLINSGERLRFSIPYGFEKQRLHRIDLITATQRGNNLDKGVAVYDAWLRR